MSEVTNSQLARKWFEEVWNQRKESTVLQMLHPNIVGYMEGLEVHAPEDFLRGRAALLDAFPDFRVTVEAVVSEGDDVAVRWSAAGTHRGAGLGLAPSLRQVSFRGMSWLLFSEGRIVKGWDSWNQGLLLQQLREPPEVSANTGAA